MQTKPDYGIDAPATLRNLWLGAVLCPLIGLALPGMIHSRVAHIVAMNARSSLLICGVICVVEAVLFTVYVKFGKFKHRDFMLAMHDWRGDEQVLDVGCGRGLLLAGAAKRLTTGHATGIDVWSNVDMGGNSPQATEQNLILEGITDQCTLVSTSAQSMPFESGFFEVIVSNLCVHNIYDKPKRYQALDEIVRVLAPGGTALISDFKHTGEYADHFQRAGLAVTRQWGSFATTFPPLRVVIARKPEASL